MVRTPQAFYKELGADGLAKRKTALHTRRELAHVKRHLRKRHRILDLGCGYGRCTIPLAQAGYKIVGADLSDTLLREARGRARAKDLQIAFMKEDMRALSFKDKSFERVLCLWSAFSELHRIPEQVKALKEMQRVLDVGGLAIIDLPRRRGRQEAVVTHHVEGVKSMPTYMHTKTSMRQLLRRAGIRNYELHFEDFGGRERLLVFFWA